jgi:hypothetical protein
LKPILPISVSHLRATVPEGVPVEWQGRTFASGPLTIELAGPSAGQLDYEQRQATAEFQVAFAFPEFAATLEELGASEFARPIQAVLRSSGAIQDDHSFALAGGCTVASHPLRDERLSASVLPGH